jgi:DNA-binding FadR family transcriptional regulator
MVKPKGEIVAIREKRAQSLVSDVGTGFTKVKTRRGFEYVSDQIRASIAEGRYKPGERLPSEREMAEIFGVSRQGVREAMRGLEMSGLVESRPGVTGGAFILDGDPEVVTRAMNDLASLGALTSESLFEARVLLTEDVIRLVVDRASEDDLARLDADIEAFEVQQRGDADFTPGRSVRITNFYHLLSLATHNEVLVMLMRSLTEIVQGRLNNVGPEPLTDVTQMRRKFMKAVRAGDADAAVQQMTEHLRRVERQLIAREQERAAEAS